VYQLVLDGFADERGGRSEAAGLGGIGNALRHFVW